MPFAVSSPCPGGAALPVPLVYEPLAGTKHLGSVLRAVSGRAGSQHRHFLRGTPGQLRVSSRQDTAGLNGLSCGFLRQFSSCCKVDKLSYNKLSHLGHIRLTDRQHLFFNINYLS